MLLVALDIDGTLIDTTRSFTRIVRELSAAGPEEIALLRAHGGFNDDWELARALKAFVDAGRPPAVLEALPGLTDYRDVVRLCGTDPGDLSPQCIALYRGGYHHDEDVLVDGALLHALSARTAVAACTGRDQWEFLRAQEKLGFVFPRATTMEDVKKPDPRALLRLVDEATTAVLLVGDTGADAQCAQRAAAHIQPVYFFRVDARHPAAPLLHALQAAPDLHAVLASSCIRC